MYSFHSSLEEKNELLYTLTQYGIETTVDRSAKKDRIREWIQSSVIEEEDDGMVADTPEPPQRHHKYHTHATSNHRHSHRQGNT
jgi:serine/threonine-protein kinase SBK